MFRLNLFTSHFLLDYYDVLTSNSHDVEGCLIIAGFRIAKSGSDLSSEGENAIY